MRIKAQIKTNCGLTLDPSILAKLSFCCYPFIYNFLSHLINVWQVMFIGKYIIPV